MSGTDSRKGYDPVPILIYDRKKDVRWEEISLLAYDSASTKVLAAGKDALPLCGSATPNLVVRSPLRYGVVADFRETLVLFQYLLQKTGAVKTIAKPRIAVCVPAGLTEVEQKAFQEVFYQAGAKEVFLTEEPAGKALQSLSSNFRLFIEIAPQETKPKWRAVWKEKVPAGQYEVESVHYSGTNAVITLQSSTDRLEVRFQNPISVQVFQKGKNPDWAAVEQETGRLSNVFYQREKQRRLDQKTEFPSGVSNPLCTLLAGKNETIEILSEAEPTIHFWK